MWPAARKAFVPGKHRASVRRQTPVSTAHTAHTAQRLLRAHVLGLSNPKIGTRMQDVQCDQADLILKPMAYADVPTNMFTCFQAA